LNGQLPDSRLLLTLTKLSDIHGENSFKAKSYATAAFTIEKLPMAIERNTAGKIIFH